MESERKLKVYVTNFSGHDFSKAEKFGEIAWITRGYVSFHSLDRVKFRICEEVDKSSEDDYLLLSGIPIICVLCATYWLWKHKKCKMLVHDKKKDGEYRELLISDKNYTDILKVLSHGTA